MLILVAVTINMAINGGLFGYAGKAVGDTQNAINSEQVLANGRIQVDGIWYDSIDAYLSKTPSANQNKEEDTEIQWKQLEIFEKLPEIQTWASINNKELYVLGLDAKGDIYEYTSFNDVDEISAQIKELIRNNGRVMDICTMQGLGNIYIMDNGKAFVYLGSDTGFLCVNEVLEAALGNEKIVYANDLYFITENGKALGTNDQGPTCLNDDVTALKDKRILNAGSYALSDSETVTMVVLEDQKAYYIDSEGNLVCFSELKEELKNKKIIYSRILSGEAFFITGDGKAYFCYKNEFSCISDYYNGLKDKKIVKVTTNYEFILDNGDLMFYHDGQEDYVSITNEFEELKDKKIMETDMNFSLFWLEDGKSYYSIDYDMVIDFNYKEILTGKNIQQISCGDSYIVALDNEGKVWTWGLNEDGQLGNGTNDNVNTPICISDIEEHPLNNIEIVQVSVGSCVVAIDSEGKVWSWGDNYFGQLGNGTNDDVYIPICISDMQEHPLNNIEMAYITTGSWHVLALDNEGRVWTWGYNNVGQLGIGTTTDTNTPVCISNMEGNPLSGMEVVRIEAGAHHALGLDNNGRIWTWGDNSGGQLGYESIVGNYFTSPICISDMEGHSLNNIDVVQIMSGSWAFHSIAIDNEGKVWSWGNNGKGQLGDGTRIRSTNPICISDINTSLQGKNIVKIEAYGKASVLLDDNNKVYVFGGTK